MPRPAVRFLACHASILPDRRHHPSACATADNPGRSGRREDRHAAPALAANPATVTQSGARGNSETARKKAQADLALLRQPSAGGRLASETMAALRRNRWPLCVGIGGRLPSESLAALRRNTHLVQGEQINLVRQASSRVSVSLPVGGEGCLERDLQGRRADERRQGEMDLSRRRDIAAREPSASGFRPEPHAAISSAHSRGICWPKAKKPRPARGQHAASQGRRSGTAP